eukprot:196400-Ditylum_brightwellii.AAC.1
MGHKQSATTIITDNNIGHGLTQGTMDHAAPLRGGVNKADYYSKHHHPMCTRRCTPAMSSMQCGSSKQSHKQTQ